MASFRAVLHDYLNELSSLRARGATEATIRDRFLAFLRNAFPALTSQFDPILLEQHLPGIRAKGRFADALYRDLIFEFKRKLDPMTRRAGQQALADYLLRQEEPESGFGILTDGELLEVYVLRGQSLDNIDRIILSRDNEEDVRIKLDCYLFHEIQRTPTPDDIIARFGEHSPSFWHSIRLLQNLWNTERNHPANQVKFLEWHALLSIVYGTPVGDENLFLRHTYLALLSRSLAFVVVTLRQPTDEEVLGIITGETFERLGFDNFSTHDFFSWAIAAGDLVRSLSSRLVSTYRLQEIRADLLKHLYEGLVDPQTRHDLGEFYTPDWLAELTLEEVGFTKKPGTLIDPACGSGTFLFTAIRLLRDSGLAGDRLVEASVRNLVGMDVHPLAVTIAKTNFILALGDDIREARRRIQLPIYMADALLHVSERGKAIPVPVDVSGIERRFGKKSSRVPSAFLLPEDLADDPVRFHEAIGALVAYSSPDISDSVAEAGFTNRLKALGIGAAEEWYWQNNLLLMRWLMKEPQTDTVWRFILENAYQPEIMSRRKFDYVVGNPPWLTYHFLANGEYKERIKSLTLRYGLLTTRDTHLFTQMELATLFFAYCMDRYLSPHGRIAFVMPRSILTGASQHRAFQQQYVRNAKKIIDCEGVRPLFNVPACVLISEKES